MYTPSSRVVTNFVEGVSSAMSHFRMEPKQKPKPKQKQKQKHKQTHNRHIPASRVIKNILVCGSNAMSHLQMNPKNKINQKTHAPASSVVTNIVVGGSFGLTAFTIVKIRVVACSRESQMKNPKTIKLSAKQCIELCW